MKRITAIVPDASEAEDSVRLDHDLRNRRRMVFTTAGGASILLDMARAVHLHHGDGLLLDDGSVVRVEAAPGTCRRSFASPGISATAICRRSSPKGIC
jgi:urease accessory protein